MTLRAEQYTFANALFWGNCANHFKSSSKGSLGHRAVHFVIALSEILPIAGQIVSIFEKIIASKWLLKEGFPNSPSPLPSQSDSAEEIAPESAASVEREPLQTSPLPSQSDSAEVEFNSQVEEIRKAQLISSAEQPWLFPDFRKTGFVSAEATECMRLNELPYDQFMSQPPSRVKNYVFAERETSSVVGNEIIPYVFVGGYEALREIASRKIQIANPARRDDWRWSDRLGTNFEKVISLRNQGKDPRQPDHHLTIKGFDRVSTGLEELIEVEIADLKETSSAQEVEAVWANLSGKFEDIFKAIDRARLEKKNILIHCSQGQSRSVTVMAAYLISRFNISAEEAIRFIKTKRSCAEPAPGFVGCLKRLERH